MLRIARESEMAGGRSGKASKPGKKRVGRKDARATPRKRTVVLDGIFSIEEIEVKGTSRRKAAKPAKKKAVPKKSASPKKRASAKKKATATKKVGQKVAARAKPAVKRKTARKTAATKPGLIVLVGSPGIKTVAELQDTLAKAHGGASAVVVDASVVESIDTAALQLLVAFTNSIREQSRTIEWKEPSSEFREMAELVDLSRGLGIDDSVVAEEDDGLCPVF